jgi:hypothetical protein
VRQIRGIRVELCTAAVHPPTRKSTAHQIEVSDLPAFGDAKDVGVNGGIIARHCLELGLLDEITLDLVPVLLGGGVPYLEHVKTAPILLDGPTITEGSRITHLHYVVRKP